MEILRDELPGFIAGGCAGLTNVFAGYPIDTLKVRLQNKQKSQLRFGGCDRVIH